ncbi:SUMF1/EgtB/PvdO family nonheme iron enzyme [Tautonia sociabilis]|uniref:Sulfatase-modifying factor enzyme-like domain-containing protein n=1 Tax=Tautonia sociabilis TaxID=2080755 RepID=A0A432MEX4_9BACT|nr:SUMF1/EgtB/PvdO family nonheme iron enzyme [Tautonia sociabilis]RUL84232.1 hypothetical protein TsocGM_20805 [Tautonia sociabilis]
MAEFSSSEYELATPSSEQAGPGRPPLPIDDEEAPPPVRRPGPPSPPKPLPRISRSAPLTTEEAEENARAEAAPSRPSRRGRRRGRGEDRPESKEGEGDEGRLLVAPTPTLDTVETRHRIRLALGIAAGLSVVLAIMMIVRAVGGGGGGDEEGVYVIDASQMFPPTAPVDGRALGNAEQERLAQDLLVRSRSALTLDVARSQLQRIVDRYPNSRTAVEARAALDRIAQGLPPFPDVPTLAPSGLVASVEAPSAAPVGVGASAPADAARLSPAVSAAEAAPEPAPPSEPVLRVLPPGFSPAEDAEQHASGWPTRIVCERDGSTMVLVPAGSYLMGRDDGLPTERPAHRVGLPSFYIDEHEVTVGQYLRYREAMARRGESPLPAPEELSRLSLGEAHPVVMISAREALRYAEWTGKSLPTEAQWEAAARGPEGLIRPWGPSAAPWGDRRPRRSVDPVASYPEDRSPVGAFDLAANAWEWTADWFDGDVYAPRAGRVLFNPGGPARPTSTPARQTVRGSSEDHDVTHRIGQRTDTRLPYLGFRCALNVDGIPLLGDPSPPAAGSPPAARPAIPPANPNAPPPTRSNALVPF